VDVLGVIGDAREPLGSADEDERRSERQQQILEESQGPTLYCGTARRSTRTGAKAFRICYERGMADLSETDIKVDPTTLYREDTYTDRRVGVIRQLTPVTSDGAVDPYRSVLFVGQAQIMTAGGILPISFEIDATSLSGAIQGFSAAAKQALEDTVRELQELRRQAASQLVIPEPGTASSILGAGGGKIRLP
jgi:hypothetical protein